MTPAGSLILSKPLHKTSMQACAAIRARFKRADPTLPKRLKVGHGGTLDPLATGVLVILVGKATKLQDRVMAGKKSYLAEVDLAHTSITDDREGELEPVNVRTPPTCADIEQALPAFTGTIMQRPPAYSAMKVGGRRAYALARSQSAETPVLEPRPITIHRLTLTDYAWPIATLRIDCGKGTYIRSLARDLGAALGTGGMLHSLVRTRVGPFSINNAVELDALPDKMTQGDLTPIDELLKMIGGARDDQSSSSDSESERDADGPDA